MRQTFSRLITKAAQHDPKVLLLTGDHGYALFDEFRKARPDQYINCGIAEQNMVGVAAGLAKAGYKPIVYGLAAFVPLRVLEQIKIDVCYEELPVLFVGDGAGVVYAQLGTSHQSTEDIAALRPMPNITITSPADKFELDYCFNYLLGRSPGYLRFGKADLGDIHSTLPNAPIGDLLKVRQGTDTSLAIIATGSMVSTAIKVAASIGDVPVWSVPFISPINADQVHQIASNVERIFVIEEHSEQGGLCGLISEIVSADNLCKVHGYGTKKFSQLCGTYSYLMEYHGLAPTQLEQAMRAELAR